MWIAWTLLTALAWAGINVLDSFLVHRYNPRPLLLMWSQSLFTLTTIIVLAFFLPVQTSWWLPLMLFGVTAYIGDVVFLWRLQTLDVSVVNGAWAIQAILQSLVGFWLFGESWTSHQFIGAACVLGAVSALTFWHRHISWGWTLFLLTTLAMVYMPVQIFQKYALLHGINPLTVIFWTILPREVLAFTIPWFRSDFRELTKDFARNMKPGFLFVSAFVVFLFFVGIFSGIYAYATGPFSLVSVVGNIQPFIILLFTGMWGLFSPMTTPKELLTRQSLTIKIASFSMVFIGLAILVY